MAKVANIAGFGGGIPTAVDLNTRFEQIIDAFTNTLSRDGSAPNQMLDALDMNNHRILNLPRGLSATEPLRVIDLTATSFVGTITNNTIVLRNIALLRALNGIGTMQPLATTSILQGYTTYADNGGGTFILDPTDTTTADDGFLTIVDAAGGRWKRAVQGASYVPEMAGAVGDNAVDDTVAVKAVWAYVTANNKTIEWLSSYKITSSIPVTTNGGFKIIGRGQNTGLIQHTDNTPIFHFTIGMFVNQWTIEGRMTLGYSAAQAWASNPLSIAFYFDGSAGAQYFDFTVEGVLFSNCNRCFWTNQATNGLIVWGYNIESNIRAMNCSGAFINFAGPAGGGAPRSFIKTNYITTDPANTNETDLHIQFCDGTVLICNEFNAGTYTGAFPQLQIDTSAGITLIGNRTEGFQASSAGTVLLWSFPGSQVTSIGSAFNSAFKPTGGGNLYAMSAVAGHLAVQNGWYNVVARTDGGNMFPWFGSDLGLMDNYTFTLGVWRQDLKAALGSTAIMPRLNTFVLFQDATDFLTDADVTLTAGSSCRQVLLNTLTADRTVTLPTPLGDGSHMTIVRAAATPGAFTLTVFDPLSGRSFIIPANMKGSVRVEAYNTGNWVITATFSV